jgi:hypothetical protein
MRFLLLRSHSDEFVAEVGQFPVRIFQRLMAALAESRIQKGRTCSCYIA